MLQQVAKIVETLQLLGALLIGHFRTLTAGLDLA